MGAPFPSSDLSPFRDSNDDKHATRTMCQGGTTSRVGICIHAIHGTMRNDKGAHYQLEAHGNVIFHPFI